ncbi:MAG: helix-turn-helix transcriptional regulator [Salibacteraceae bacterium]
MRKYSTKQQPADVMQILAERIKVLRKQKKWSQTELAERSGVSLGSLKRFERTGQISLKSLLKLTLTLGRLEDFDALLQPAEQRDLNKLFTR